MPAGQGFSAAGVDQRSGVCQGTIAAASGGAINLNNGLALSGNGNVNLGSTGSLTVNDAASGIAGGTLSMGNMYVGSGGTGVFTQTGGTTRYSQPMAPASRWA